MENLYSSFKRAVVLTVFVLIFGGLLAPTNLYSQDINSPEGIALMAIYNATDGPNWTNDTNWGSPTVPLANWFGVTVSGGKVTKVHLGQNNLNGVLPDVFASLPDLTFLHLKKNQLSGAVPASMGALVNLTFLGLNECDFSGSLPAGMSNLTKLRECYLQGNAFTGDVPDLHNSTNLQYLYLIDNQFSGFAGSGLSGLTYVKELRVQNNNFEFDDLIPLLGLAPLYVYAPQAKVGTASNVNGSVGGNVTITMNVASGSGVNSYQWYKDATSSPGATSSSLTIDPLALSDSGVYTCKAKNSLLPLLTLEQEAITLTVVGGPSNIPDWYITLDYTSGLNSIVIDQPAPATPAVEEAYAWVETLVEVPNTHFEYLLITPAMVDFTDAVPPGGDNNTLVDNWTNGPSSQWVRPFRYKIQVKDANDQVSALSDYQQSVHLTASLSVNSDWVNLIWTPYLGLEVDYYEIWGAQNVGDFIAQAGSYAKVVTLPNTITSYTDINNSVNGFFWYQIKTYFVAGGGGEPFKSGSVKFSDSNMSALVNENGELVKPTLTIYPNPVTDQAVLKFDNPANVDYTLRIMDLTGKVFVEVQNITGTEYIFRPDHLAPGIYLVQLEGQAILSSKMVIY